MDIPAALRILGLTEEVSAEEITELLASKKANIEEKKAVAPTEVLKQKFDEILDKFDRAAEVLLEAANNKADAQGKEDSEVSHNALQPGHILSGRFEIKALIGQGGMDAVYRAVDIENNCEIAVKVLRRSLTRNEEALALFLKEAKISAELDHPNIANVYGVHNEGSLYFLTMELLEGQNLAEFMLARHQAEHTFSENELLVLVEQLISALSYAHQRTVHREIKPENIWVDNNGYFKLMDFGIVQLQDVSERMQNCADIGTVYYMAPEQIKGDGNVDARADIYALGIMLYHLATGSVPAGLIKPLNEKRPDLGTGFCEAVMQCMEADVADRPQSVEELMELLQKKIEKPAQSSEIQTDHAISSQSRMPLVAAVIFAVVAGIAFLVFSGSKETVAPVEPDLLAQKKAEAIKLSGQIKSLKKRLDEGLEDLEKDVTEARRENSQQFQKLQLWHENSKQFIVNSSTLTDLEGERAVGEGFAQDEQQLEQAIEVLSKVKSGYETLFTCFQRLEGFGKKQLELEELQTRWTESGISNAAVGDVGKTLEAIEKAKKQGQGCLTLELTHRAINQYREASQELQPLFSVEKQTEEARMQWEQYKKKFGIENPSAITDAELAVSQAEKQKLEGLIKEAIVSNKSAIKYYADAYDQVSQLVEAKKAKWAEAHKLEAERLVKAKEAKQAQFQKGKTVSVNGTSIRFRGIPAGSFQMGSNNGDADEKPVHTVNIKAFYLQETEVTWDQYQICIDDYVCESGGDELDGKGSRPVINVSWDDAQVYIQWLNKKTGQRFRLPSEAEWEYAARAGSREKYSWGNDINCSKAHYNGGEGSGCYFAPDGDDTGAVPVKSFSANKWGLYDMHGNIWEWVQDCWNDSYNGAPSNGKAWVSGNCKKRVVRGGSWGFGPSDLRSANREIFTAAKRHYFFGFRLAQDL